VPRASRVVLANHPHHIVQRGHNRRAVFTREADYEYFLATMRECRAAYGVKVYAYCLMTDHIHLILEPSVETATLGKFMKCLAGRQTRYVNRLEVRRGTLWESRYKSSVVQAESYLLACCRYVELNPVRSGMVGDPDQYRWSSYRGHIGLERESLLDPFPCLSSYDSPSENDRRWRYKDFVAEAIPDGEWQLIREAVQRCQLTGDRAFIGEVEKIVGRRIELRGQGRPRRAVRDVVENRIA
jgi:putative transposase